MGGSWRLRQGTAVGDCGWGLSPRLGTVPVVGTLLTCQRNSELPITNYQCRKRWSQWELVIGYCSFAVRTISDIEYFFRVRGRGQSPTAGTVPLTCPRSEERRVGKECRSRRPRSH